MSQLEPASESANSPQSWINPSVWASIPQSTWGHVHVAFTPMSEQTQPLASEETTEVIVGYRAWNLQRRYPTGSLLLSRTSWLPWTPHERLVARCINTPGADHVEPVHGCTCGIYAYRNAVDAPFPDRDATPIVVGSVSLWGRVIEHEDGYRAQYAYPKELVLIGGSDKLAADLAFTYGVPCEVW